MSDYLVRAMAANAQIRAFAVGTRDLVETARAAHNTSPVVTAALGRLLTAGTMMGAMLKGEKDILTLAKAIIADNSLKTCPHGRPVAMWITKYQLEKQFGRIG